jgi:hypothetical protein
MARAASSLLALDPNQKRPPVHPWRAFPISSGPREDLNWFQDAHGR